MQILNRDRMEVAAAVDSPSSPEGAAALDSSSSPGGAAAMRRQQERLLRVPGKFGSS